MKKQTLEQRLLNAEPPRHQERETTNEPMRVFPDIQLEEELQTYSPGEDGVQAAHVRRQRPT